MRELMEIIEPSTVNRLATYGIHSVDSLLERCRTEEDQRKFAHGIGLSTRRVSQWVRRADLARVGGIGGEYVSLLEAADIVSARDLSQREPKDLQELLRMVNKRRRLVKRVPALSNIQKWVRVAAELPPLYTN